jgi:hypothetical protein
MFVVTAEGTLFLKNSHIVTDVQGYAKSIPLQAWTGPEVSRGLRLLDFKTVYT